MSLFEDPLYQYSETYFVLLKKENAPKAEKIRASIAELGNRFDIEHVSEREGNLEAMTIVCDHDFAGIDIAYVEGEEVKTQIEELQEQMKTTTFSNDELEALRSLPECDARFDLFHFERLTGASEDDILDPGALLKVIDTLNGLSKGIAIDPQSFSLM